ncbi:MAG: flagellar basal body P-ring formation chaperone FlgA [Verrucomicrobiota bacterium]
MRTPISKMFRPIFVAWLATGFAVSVSADEPALSAAPPAPPAAPAAPAPAAPRPDRPFSESDLLALLTATLQQDYVHDRGQLELRFTQPWKTRNFPDTPLTVKVLEIPSQGVTPSFIIRFELRTDQATLGSWQLPVQARVWREVWVARSPAPRGTLLADADLATDKRDMLLVHEPLLDWSPGDTALELAEPLQAGAPILARAARLRPVIHRGQLADAIVQDGALNISMKVEVLEDGAPGQLVRARNPHTRHDLRGKVLNAQTIQVTL